MLGPYGAVLRVRGAAAFSAAAFVARFPISMLGLGMVLLVSARTGSFAVAGVVSAMALTAEALSGPFQARGADRFGQAAVLLVLVVLHVVALTGFLVVAWADDSLPTILALSALAGATLPQVGAFVRARWAHLVGGTPALQPAYALESILDEVIFVGGPVLVTVLAAGVHPLAGLGATLVLTSVGGVVLAAQRSTQPAPRRRSRSELKEPLGSGVLLGVAVPFLFLGANFGIIEVSTVAFADARGREALAGVLLAAFASGSMIAGVVFGTVSWPGRPEVRLLVGFLLLALFLAVTSLATSMGVLAALLAVTGVAISPTLITGFGIIEEHTPASRLTEGLAWVGTSLAIGVALGAAVAGAVIEASGPGTAFLLGCACATLAGLACLPGALPR